MLFKGNYYYLTLCYSSAILTNLTYLWDSPGLLLPDLTKLWDWSGLLLTVLIHLWDWSAYSPPHKMSSLKSHLSGLRPTFERCNQAFQTDKNSLLKCQVAGRKKNFQKYSLCKTCVNANFGFIYSWFSADYTTRANTLQAEGRWFDSNSSHR